MEILMLFAVQAPVWWLCLLATIGLCTGSFLNVLIYRLPTMLHNSWLNEINTLDAIEPKLPYLEPYYTLCWPRSHCPRCHQLITARDNIPLLSWFLLRGKCRHCQHPISVRYLFVELLTSITAILSGLFFTPSFALFGVLLLSWFLIALSFIDIDTMQLPDKLTFPLLWLGLFFNLLNSYVSLTDAVIGAIAGYLVLWLLYWSFKLVTDREGLGYGDFKLLSALGAWLGWKVLPDILLLASILGVFLYLWQRRGTCMEPYPFGPCLAFSGWIIILYQHGVSG